MGIDIRRHFGDNGFQDLDSFLSGGFDVQVEVDFDHIDQEIRLKGDKEMNVLRVVSAIGDMLGQCLPDQLEGLFELVLVESDKCLEVDVFEIFVRF